MSLLDTSPTSTSPVSTANFIRMPRMGTPGLSGCSTLPPSAPFPSLPAPPPPPSPVGCTTCFSPLAMAPEAAPDAGGGSVRRAGGPGSPAGRSGGRWRLRGAAPHSRRLWAQVARALRDEPSYSPPLTLSPRRDSRRGGLSPCLLI